jgi:hypothetical protein
MNGYIASIVKKYTFSQKGIYLTISNLSTVAHIIVNLSWFLLLKVRGELLSQVMGGIFFSVSFYVCRL